jgi:AcrR family transcriptional regulator
MKASTKGEITRQEILQKVNDLFNESGIDHTLVQISKSIGIGKSRITNYFPKKEDLIINLLREYEVEMADWVSNYQSKTGIRNFSEYIPYLAGIMELMFQYRRVISISLINSKPEGDVVHHMTSRYEMNKRQIRDRMEAFAKNGLIREELLEPERFEVFIFQFFCMTSNWIVMYNLLDADRDFKLVKVRYLKSILCCLDSYLTDKGRKDMANAFSTLNQN